MFKMTWNDEEVFRNIHGSAVAHCAEGASIVLKDAKRNCPEGDSGALKESGRIQSWDKGNAVGAYVVFGGQGHIVNGVDTFYAPFVELGTPGTVFKNGKKKGRARVAIAAQPFIRTALRKNEKRILHSFDGKEK